MTAKLNFQGYLKKNKKAKVIKDFDSSEHEALARFENLKKRLYIKDRSSIARDTLEPIYKDIISRASFPRRSIDNSVIKFESDIHFNDKECFTQDDSFINFGSMKHFHLDEENQQIEKSIIKNKGVKVKLSPSVKIGGNKSLSKIKTLTTIDGEDSIFNHIEIEKILNLKTKNFKDLPQNPLKIAEASFSDVYKSNNLIYKIIAFNEFYSIESFYKELFVLETLKSCEGICRVVDRFIVKGKYTRNYINEWQRYRANKESENVCPSMYKPGQLFGVIIMEDCGVDLENTIFSSYMEVHVFLENLFSTISSLENRFHFEHRDMHWGNIMIKGSKTYLIDFNFTRLEAKLFDGRIYDLNFNSGTSKILFTNLNKEKWLFEGDDEVDFQFYIYKRMKMSCNGDWRSFNVESNLLWIIYIIDKLWSKIKNFKTGECKIKSTNLIKHLLEVVKDCKNTTDLLLRFKNYLLVNKS